MRAMLIPHEVGGSCGPLDHYICAVLYPK